MGLRWFLTRSPFWMGSLLWGARCESWFRRLTPSCQLGAEVQRPARSRMLWCLHKKNAWRRPLSSSIEFMFAMLSWVVTSSSPSLLFYITYPVFVAMKSFVIFRVHRSSAFFASELRRYAWIPIIHYLKVPYNIQWYFFSYVTLKTDVYHIRLLMQSVLRLFLSFCYFSFPRHRRHLESSFPGMLLRWSTRRTSPSFSLLQGRLLPRNQLMFVKYFSLEFYPPPSDEVS